MPVEESMIYSKADAVLRVTTLSPKEGSLDISRPEIQEFFLKGRERIAA